jgi:RNA polymerase sigma-70 factor, ECF subfamily
VKRTIKSRVATVPNPSLVATASLMQEFQQGIGDQLWRAYRVELLRFVLKRVRNKTLAEDIVHDVLCKAYGRQDTLKDFRKLRPWLYQITRNAIVDYHRSEKPLESLPEELVGEEAEGVKSAEQELARCLLPLVNNLPPPYRRAVTLAEIEGLTQREVASTLGLSLSGAKSRVQRARKILTDSLLDCCRIELDRRGGVVDYECGKACDVC